jgi:hypothetical protein
MPFILLVWQSLKICTAFGSGFFGPHRLSSVFGTSQYRYDNMAQKKEGSSSYLQEPHSVQYSYKTKRTVGFVLQTVSLEDDTLERHIHKYKFNMWSDQIHIAYLILWSDQCLTRVVQSSSVIYSTGDVGAISLLALPSK